MTVKLQTEQHLEFLSLKEDCTGSSESTLVKMSHCWKSHATAQIQTTGSASSVNYNFLTIFWVVSFQMLNKGGERGWWWVTKCSPENS